MICTFLYGNQLDAMLIAVNLFIHGPCSDRMVVFLITGDVL